MRLQTAWPIPREEWKKSLHAEADEREQLELLMSKAEKLLWEHANPRRIYRIVLREELPEGGISIARHLEGCEEAAVLAVTLGAGIDDLIRRTQITDMALATVVDTGASLLAEHAADEAEEIIRQDLAISRPEMFVTPRFSPGYGDYALEHQRDILTLVDAPRKIGLALTAGGMMTPGKSVTAVMGIADHPVKGRLATCSECVLRDKCPLWARGEHC